MQGQIASINISRHRGEPKTPVSEINLVAGHGLGGDAHAGSARQVSMLATESVSRAAATGIELKPGDFGENISTLGLDLSAAHIGQRLQIGGNIVLQVSEVGKICHNPCSIGKKLGDCIMPREGVFAKVLRGGKINIGDPIGETTLKVGAVITSSDRCVNGEREDESGQALMALLDELGVVVADYSILPDEASDIMRKMIFLADHCSVDLILTTGGTGFTPRDRMPEATTAVIDAPAPGIAEAIRHEGLKYTPYACISRGVSGLRGRTLIVNLPGSKRAITQSSDLLRAALPHALAALRMETKDCGPVKEPLTSLS